MLSKEQKKTLKTLAMQLPSQVQIGKSNLSDNLFETLSNDLNAHELVKVTLQRTCELTPREAAIECSSATGSEIVQIIGRTFVLYKRSKENKLGLKR
jgi:RNA-binding protein